MANKITHNINLPENAGSFWDIAANHLKKTLNDTEYKEAIIKFRNSISYRDTTQLKSRLSKLTVESVKKQLPQDGDVRNWLIFAHLFNYSLNIPLSEFGLDSDIERVIKKKDIHNNENHLPSPVLDLQIDSTTDIDTYEDTFLKSLYEPLQRLSNSLIVYDYLEKQSLRSKRIYQSYSNVHKQIYDNIFNKLKNYKIDYVRYLALPIHFKDIFNISQSNEYLNNELNNIKQKLRDTLAVKDIVSKDEIDTILNLAKDNSRKDIHEAAINHVIDATSVVLFEHLYKCLKWYENDKKTNTEPKFYIIMKASKAYHWGIIDDGKCIITEYYRYNKDGICKPDILYIEELNKQSSVLLSVYKKDITRLESTESDAINPKLHYSALTKSINYLFKKAQEEYDIALKKNNENLTPQNAKNLELAKAHLEITEKKHNIVFKNGTS